MAKFFILGRGFGLYGYLPAILSTEGNQAEIPEAYRGVAFGREDLIPYRNQVTFAPDAEKAPWLGADVLVVAKRPADQEAVVAEVIRSGWRGALLLEKPLAPTPDRALVLFDRLVASGLTFRLGFLFPFTGWAKMVCQALSGPGVRLDIRWSFHAHHHHTGADTWKNHETEGGGPLRFYCVHLIHLLSLSGGWEVNHCNIEGDSCKFSVRQYDKTVEVHCDTNADRAAFSVGGFYQSPEPFLDLESSREDRRCFYLRHLIASLGRPSWEFYPAYSRHIDLWERLERHARG